MLEFPYQVWIVNKDLQKREGAQFVNCKSLLDLDRAERAYKNTVRDYGSALHVELREYDEDTGDYIVRKQTIKQSPIKS